MVARWKLLSLADDSAARRRVAGCLLIVSGITHVAQLAVYPSDPRIFGAALFGVAYFGIGCGLLREHRAALSLGAVLPAIGGVLGTIRLFFVQRNPFSVFHVAIDLVVVPICVHLLFRERVRGTAG